MSFNTAFQQTQIEVWLALFGSGTAQRSISPNTISSDPMIADTSASICPQVKKPIACK
jgi:hypothetical protein